MYEQLDYSSIVGTKSVQTPLLHLCPKAKTGTGFTVRGTIPETPMQWL